MVLGLKIVGWFLSGLLSVKMYRYLEQTRAPYEAYNNVFYGVMFLAGPLGAVGPLLCLVCFCIYRLLDYIGKGLRVLLRVE